LEEKGVNHKERRRTSLGGKARRKGLDEPLNACIAPRDRVGGKGDGEGRRELHEEE